MSLRLSQLTRRIVPSGTVAADERMQRLRAAGRDIVSLGAGQLDFDTPEPIASAGRSAIDDGDTRYTPVAGTNGLRAAVREKFRRENAVTYSDDEVIVGAGAKGVIFHGLLALVDPDDVVLVPTPGWPSYASMVALAGGTIAPVPLEAGAGYRLSAAAVKDAVQAARGRARGLILNSPHNPTGTLLARGDLEAIARVAAEADLWVISDEIYEHLLYEGEFTSFAAVDGARERTLTVNGVSKAYAMTGWRIGFGGGPVELVRTMEALQSHTTGNASSIAQRAAETALRLTVSGDPLMLGERERFRAALRERRDTVCAALLAIRGVRLIRPAGAFYVFADVSAHYGRTLEGRTIRGSSDLADHLLEHAGVAVVPGAVFGDDRCVRLSFAAALEELQRALERIRLALA